MPSFKIPNRALVGAHNNLVILQTWLRPGWAAYVIGANVDAMRTDTTRVVDTRNAMLREVGKLQPDKLENGQPNPNAGELVTRDIGGGQSLVVFKTPETGTEFERREKELMDAETEITVSDRITLDLIKRLDEERLPVPKSTTIMAVDFSAIMCVVERPEPEPPAAKTGARRRSLNLPTREQRRRA